MRSLVVILLSLVLSISVVQAQVVIPGTNFTLTPVNGGTGTLTTVPIPGGSGLSVVVGTGSAAIPLQDIRNNSNAVNITTSDDGWNNVPLGFDFPFYGRVFNNSWAMTNGVVTFQDPIQSGAYGLCCSGVDLRTTTDPRYNYSIYGLHTDLYSWNGQNQYYLRGTNEMTYGWYNVSQCCSSSGGNSFEIKINSAGLVDTRIAGAMIQWNMVTSGMAGDLSKGEYFQAYHSQGINITPGGPNIMSWQALSGTGPVDMCLINPLYSISCPGYQAAYTTQQCTISALWDPSCPGYQTAYFNQQCSINALYNSSCPGYETAYFNQQCSLNPLYSTRCSGYADAYHTQQCSANPLYMTDCPGYASAYLEQQCSINPLYSTTCSGYAAAYKAQQCALDGLYDRTCPNYSTAYATKMLLEQQNIASTVATAGVVAQTAPSPTTTTASTTTASTSISSDGSVSVGVSKTGDTNVDKAIAAPVSTTNTAAAPSAPVQLVAAPPAPTAPTAPTAKNESGEKKPESGDKTTGPTQTAQSQQSTDSKPAAPTARQEIQARREAAAKAAAVEKGKNLAGEMGKAADMESQKAVQNVVIQAMGFTPGFDAYGKTTIPDTAFYRPYAVYTNQQNVDNRRLGRGLFGPTDQLHNRMVEQQYEGR